MIEVALQGRLGKDAQLDHVRGGELARLVFSIVVLGQREDADNPRWVQCTMFGDKAQDMAPRLTKGTRCYIEGRMAVSPFLGSLNEKRRHLTESQRAMVAAKIATLDRGDNQHTAIAATSQGDAGAPPGATTADSAGTGTAAARTAGLLSGLVATARGNAVH